jgi:RHS repeat-associated protein
VNYAFDAVGNRTSRSYGFSGAAQAPTYTVNDWLASDSYDSNGNTTVSGTTNYQYDALDHLTNVTSGTTVITMTYDGDGNRVSKTVAGSTTYYLVDDRNPSGYAQVLEEYQDTSLSRAYNYGSALISQSILTPNSQLPASVFYYGTDGHGSTRFLTDVSGTLTDTYTYDAYGILVVQTSNSQLPTSNSYLYCGQQLDSDLGMYYLRARYYKPDTGRFWTMDTYDGNSEDPLSLHKYLYAQNDPVDNDDPSGKMVYKLQVKSSFVVSGYCVLDHRLIVGDTGTDYSGSCYSLEFWGDEGALFGSKYEPVKVATWHYTLYQASAEDTIKAIIKKAGGGKVADKVKTNVDVDKQLNLEAAQLNGYADTYVLGWNDCGTGANKWLNEALRLQPRFVPPLTGGQNYISSFSIDIGSVAGFGL